MKKGMKKGCPRFTGYFTGAVLCLAVSAVLITRFPDEWDGQVLNPAIALAKYALPAVGLLLLLEGAWSLGLAIKGREQRCLAVSLVTILQRHWDLRDCRDREIHEELLRRRAAGRTAKRTEGIPSKEEPGQKPGQEPRREPSPGR